MIEGVVAMGGGGAGGGAWVRSTPADDLVTAIGNLNRAIDAAKRAGWAVDVTVTEPSPNEAQSVAVPYRTVRAFISKEA